MLNTMQNEIWKPINYFERFYEISSLGRVSNYRKILKPSKINSGYLKISLSSGGYKQYKLIHRLVAEHFIENPENKREVNHKDGNKLNNNVSNLEWVSSSENKIHSYSANIREYNIPTLGIKLGVASSYHNVTYDKSRNKWQATVRVNGKNMYTKRFKIQIEAARHVNWILDTLQLTDRPRNNV